MKNILQLLFAVLISNTAFSQTIKPLQDYYTYNNLNDIYFKDVNNTYGKFLGTWEYSNGPYYLKITIEKATKVKAGYPAKTQYSDYLICDYLYKYNGQVIYDSSTETINGNPKLSSIWGHTIKADTVVYLFYDEPSTTACERIRRGDLILTYIPNGSTPQLKWDRTDHLNGSPGTTQLCPSGAFDDSEYKIPANMILNKI